MVFSPKSWVILECWDEAGALRMPQEAWPLMKNHSLSNSPPAPLIQPFGIVTPASCATNSRTTQCQFPLFIRDCFWSNAINVAWLLHIVLSGDLSLCFVCVFCAVSGGTGVMLMMFNPSTFRLFWIRSAEARHREGNGSCQTRTHALPLITGRLTDVFTLSSQPDQHDTCNRGKGSFSDGYRAFIQLLPFKNSLNWLASDCCVWTRVCGRKGAQRLFKLAPCWLLDFTRG